MWSKTPIQERFLLGHILEGSEIIRLVQVLRNKTVALQQVHGTTVGSRNLRRVSVIIVTFPNAGGEADLFEVVYALDAGSALWAGVQSGQDKNRHEENDDQQHYQHFQKCHGAICFCERDFHRLKVQESAFANDLFPGRYSLLPPATP